MFNGIGTSINICSTISFDTIVNRASKLLCGKQDHTLRASPFCNIQQVCEEGRVFAGSRGGVFIQLIHKNNDFLGNRLIADTILLIKVSVLQRIDRPNNIPKNKTLKLLRESRNIYNHHFSAVDVQHFVRKIYLMLFFLAWLCINKNIIVNGIVNETAESLPWLNQDAGVIFLSA